MFTKYQKKRSNIGAKQIIWSSNYLILYNLHLACVIIYFFYISRLSDYYLCICFCFSFEIGMVKSTKRNQWWPGIHVISTTTMEFESPWQHRNTNLYILEGSLGSSYPVKCTQPLRCLQAGNQRYTQPCILYSCLLFVHHYIFEVFLHHWAESSNLL